MLNNSSIYVECIIKVVEGRRWINLNSVTEPNIIITCAHVISNQTECIII